MLLSSDSYKEVQELIVKGKYQSTVICGLAAPGIELYLVELNNS